MGAVSTANLQQTCSGCFSASKKVSRCAACKALHYCSAQCQRQDWAQHKTECAALTRLRGMWARAYPDRARAGGDVSWVMNEGVRALGRMCWRRRAERAGGGKDADWVSWAMTAAKADGQWTQVANMESRELLGPGCCS